MALQNDKTKKAFYRGYSTQNWLDKAKSLRITNVECVKRDILNHIWTIKGERLMMPDFGTRIPLLAFEPNDSITLQTVEEDLRTVFEYDPRVRLLALKVMALPDNNAIIALADIVYVEFEVKETLRIEIPRQS